MEPDPLADPFERDPRLRTVRDHLDLHISQSLTLDEAARIAGLSPAYFSHYFRRKVGIRFTAWRHSVRLREALAILDASTDAIPAVAARVGYPEVRTFERVFRRCMGMTPREYRRRAAQGGRERKPRLNPRAERND
jgi:AraC-like DNA-binding protein